VPACSSCNEASKLDDEYFRWLVASIGDSTPASDLLIRQRVLPRFKRHQALLHDIMSKARLVDVISPGGIWLEQRPAFEFDRPRIQRVIARTVRGLYLHEFSKRLDRVPVKEFILDPVLSDDDRRAISALPLRDVATNVFSYRFVADSAEQRRSLWFLMFFNKALFLAMTEPDTSTTS